MGMVKMSRKKKSKKRRKGVRRKKVSELTAREKTRLKTIHQRRSKRARSLDEKYAAKTPVYVSTWIRNPGRYDIPGIDMGKQRKTSRSRKEPDLDVYIISSSKPIRIKKYGYVEKGKHTAPIFAVDEIYAREAVKITGHMFSLRKLVNIRLTRSGKAYVVESAKKPGKVVFLPAKYVKVKKTYMLMPKWLYEKKKSEIEKTLGFKIVEKKEKIS